MGNWTPEPWVPNENDMPPMPLRAAKRVNLTHYDDLGDWFGGHGKDKTCFIEGTADHWFWLAYTLIGLVKPKDCPYTEAKPLPFHKDRVVSCVNALAGIEDPAALRRERDELRAACEAAEQRYRSMWFGVNVLGASSSIREEWDALKSALAHKGATP